MNELRANSVDLCMSEAMPFGQQWQYRTTWPLGEITHDQFFLGFRGQLHDGDQLRLIRFESKWEGVIEQLDVIVLASGREARAVVLAPISEHRIFGDEKAAQPAMSIVPGKSGKHKIVQGEKLVGEFGSKKEAEDAFKEMVA